MSKSKFKIEDFPKYYQIDDEGFICFVNDDGERTRIARILQSGNLEVVGKTKIFNPAARKKKYFWVKIFLFLFFMLALGSSGAIFFLNEKSAKLNEEYMVLTERYGDAVSEVVLVCRKELKKIEDFINDPGDHSEKEIEDLIKKLREISPNYCQKDTELYPKFAELSKALYVMKGKIGGRREAEARQKKDLERQEELERQREIERKQELERELAEMKRREAEQKKIDDEKRRAEQEKREKEDKERRKIEEKNKTKRVDAIKKPNNSNKKKVDNTKKKPQPESREAVKNDKQDKKIVKEEKPKAQEDDEEVSKLKQGIDKLEEWLKSLKK